jgi:hypothetical protein
MSELMVSSSTKLCLPKSKIRMDRTSRGDEYRKKAKDPMKE